MTISATTLCQLLQCSIIFILPRKAGVWAKRGQRERGRLAKKSSWAFLLNALIFPVSSGLFFSKSYFMHMLTQWQNLALSVRKVYREKKRIHLLDPKAEPHTGGMTFLGRGRAKSSPQLPWSLAHAALAQLSEEAAGRALSWGRILCFGLKEAKFNHLFGRLQCTSPTTRPQRVETEEEA